MKFYKFLIVSVLAFLAGCATSPQQVQVAPVLMLDSLKDVTLPIELVVTDKRDNVTLLGYRNAKQEGEITFSESVSKSLGEKIQSALIYQGINMTKGPQPFTRLEVELYELSYRSPDETWVSGIEMNAEILVIVKRSEASLKKRFKSNRKQDVVTAPSQEFNEGFMNALLSELINKALNDKEIVNFLK